MKIKMLNSLLAVVVAFVSMIAAPPIYASEESPCERYNTNMKFVVQKDKSVKVFFDPFTRKQIRNMYNVEFTVTSGINRKGQEDKILSKEVFQLNTGKGRLKQKYLVNGRLPSFMMKKAVNTESDNGKRPHYINIHLYFLCTDSGEAGSTIYTIYHRRDDPKFDICNLDHWFHSHKYKRNSMVEIRCNE